ncbi:Hypothetical predicted protein [Paramuricea clavata]|uniref:Uncharacterized protein n=1 Tax=Paramuricea clavata TaxID=317549 RepID=A0A6S7IFB7_PARCT|nr:Hypothetical predicted protein [Paramuricea clavata]
MLSSTDPFAKGELSSAVRFAVQADSRLGISFNVPDNKAPSISTDTKGSSWLFNGLNLRLKDWRFIHCARLNIVPTNQNKSCWSDCSTLCRVCNSHHETLPHIICHCNTHLVQIHERHNTVVERLKKAVRYGCVRVNQQVPGVDDECCPDILIDEGCEVTIIDVTCPFENGDDALATADYNKLIKYDHLKEHFHQLGVKCDLFAFVIGALGTWHPNNEAVFNQLLAEGTSPHPVTPANPSSSLNAILSYTIVVQQLDDVPVHVSSEKSDEEQPLKKSKVIGSDPK